MARSKCPIFPQRKTSNELISCSVYCIELLLNRELATGSFDKTIKIWNIESGMCLKTINTSSCVFALKQLSVNELISGSMDGSIQIYDLSSLAPKRTLLAHTGCWRAARPTSRLKCGRSRAASASTR